MSQFEYISVAVALVFALVVGRILEGLTSTLSHQRRYPVHSVWVAQILLVCVGQWWILWRTASVDWTAFRFLWVLATPAIQYARVAVLLGEPHSVRSYREHFYSVRRVFFGIGVASGVYTVLSPWVLGAVPWLTGAPIHPGGACDLCTQYCGARLLE